MAWQSGGGGLVGVTTDAQGNMTVKGGITAGDQNAATVPTFHSFYGSTFFGDSPGNNVDGDPVVAIAQRQHITSDSFSLQALLIERISAIDSGQDYGEPLLQLQGNTGSTQPVIQGHQGAALVLEVSAKESVLGHLSAVTDANAKAVLTSLLAALTGVQVAADNTT